MRSAIVRLSICAIGYSADHWQEISTGHIPEPRNAHVILYGARSSGPYIQLKYELQRQDIPFESRDLSDDANIHELNEKLERIGKAVGSVNSPVADVDGVIVLKPTVRDITKRLH